MTRQRQNICSTKPKPVPLVNVDSTLLHRVKERDMFIKIVDMKSTLYTDQTGRFSSTLQSSNQYIMVMVEVDSNAILVEPMSSRKDAEMQRAYLALLQRIKEAGVVPQKHILDNKCSNSMKKLIRETCQLELVPPYCYRRNVAEVAIKNFKVYFISILAGTDSDFPIYLWDKLLPQAELTLNLLRQANVNPKVSAHTYLFGPFDFNRFPLAPLGCAVQIHVPPECQNLGEYARGKAGTSDALGTTTVCTSLSTGPPQLCRAQLSSSTNLEPTHNSPTTTSSCEHTKN